MNFSSTTSKEREKQAKALKRFLALSLIGSLGLHLVVLAYGIGSYFTRRPQTEEEPIEITMVDPPQEKKVEVLKPEKSAQEVKVPAKTIQPPTKIELSEQPKQPVENFKKLVQSDKPVASRNINSRNSSSNVRNTLRQLRDSQSSQSPVTNNITSSATPGNGTPGGGGGGGTSVLTGNGTGSIGGSGTGNGTGSGSGNGSGIGSGNGSGIGSGNGSGIGSGNGSGNGNSGSGGQVATAPTTPKLPSNSGRGGDGRAACRECSVKYSDRARRRRAEGRVNVAVDTDTNGNVTNVRLVGSSGDRELDEEHLRQARNWKLKPSESGRQGVQISTDYAMRGSRRAQQIRKQQRERDERQRQREIAAGSNNNNESRTSRRLRRIDTAEATSTGVRRSEGENSAANRQQRRRREITSDVRASGETPQRRRRRRDLKKSSQPSASTSRLLNSLRRSSDSAPAAPSSNVTP